MQISNFNFSTPIRMHKLFCLGYSIYTRSKCSRLISMIIHNDTTKSLKLNLNCKMSIFNKLIIGRYTAGTYIYYVLL